MSPYRYLTGLRIEKAKFLLTKGKIPLAEIANLCGFSS